MPRRRLFLAALAAIGSAWLRLAAATRRTSVSSNEDGSIRIVTPSGITITIGAISESNGGVTVDSGVYRTSIGSMGVTVIPLQGVTINNPLSSLGSTQWVMNDNQGNSVMVSQSAGGRIDLNGTDAGIWVNGKKLNAP